MLSFVVILSGVKYFKHIVHDSSVSGMPVFLGTLLVASAGTALFIHLKFTPYYRARNHVEKWINVLLFASAAASIAITLAVVISIFFESLRFFKSVSPLAFFFGTHWSPQQATGEHLSEGFGILPLFCGTLLITGIAMLIAAPCGLLSAIFLSEYTSPAWRTWIKPFLEILAGIPTVVYGFFAATVMAPLLRNTGEIIGVPIATESALAAGLVMGIMIIPFVMSLSDDILHAVPRSLREGSLALGATLSETIRKVIVPAALPGIMGACLLAISRAIGETMIVFMAAGLAANFTFNPLQPVTTVTAQIVMLLVGDQEFDSPQTLAAFALGLTLFMVTLCLNVIALLIVKKYREKYE
ncbi:MAG: phosphate ABC transporter permease subunit PstC [Alphaproteobacteria bacterium]|nr:phosphate ABC transporter permease subunit PstC [Alphaproteobacteria bacterium]